MADFRIAITGPPSSGKTTIADAIGLDVRNTDDLIERGWDEAIEGVVDWLSDKDSEIIEGAIVPHALRRWMARYPAGKPVDRAVYLGSSWEELTDGQASFAKSIRTVWEDIQDDLKARGITIVDSYEGPDG